MLPNPNIGRLWAMKNANIDWVKFRYKTSPNTLICERCGSEFDMPTEPIDVRMYAGIIYAFTDIHKKCKKT